MDIGRVPVPLFEDKRGTLGVVESAPFPIKRVFWVLPTADRGGHAHKKARQLMACVQGSFTLEIDDGKEKKKLRMDAKSQAVLLEPWHWHSMVDCSKDCVMLVLSSRKYEEKDYIRDYDLFKEVHQP